MVRLSTYQAAAPSRMVTGTMIDCSPRPGRSILGSCGTWGDWVPWP